MLPRQPHISYAAVDQTGSTATLRFNIKTGLSVASAMQNATNFRSIINALSSCTITRQSVVYRFTPENRNEPLEDSSVHNVGVFIFTTSDSEQYAMFVLPGIDESVLMTTGPGAGILIDATNPLIVALVEQITSGLWYSQFGYQIDELVIAFRQVRS